MPRSRLRLALPATAAMLAMAPLSASAVQAPLSHPAQSPPEPDAGPVANVSSVTGPGQRPNIMMFLADDMRADDLQYMPHVRHLIGDRGVTFENAFAPQPLCAPSRASLFSGLYTHNHHVWSVRDPYGFQSFDDRATLPVWLHRVGYNTAFIGKYINGYGRQPTPDGHPSTTYVPPGWTDWRASIDAEGVAHSNPDFGGTYQFFNTTLDVNGTLQPHHHQYQTGMFGDQSEQILSRCARSPRPFFYLASYVAPHVGLPHESDDPGHIMRSDGKMEFLGTTARPDWVKGRFDSRIEHAPGASGEKDVSDKPFFIRRLPRPSPLEEDAMTEMTRQRAESLAVLDDQVARTVRVLRRSGELENTLILFTSDNGYFLGEHRKRQGKIQPYSPSLDIPLLMRGPGIPAGEVRRDPFLMTDIAPTFLAAAGAPREPVDGANMLPVARTHDRGWRRPVLTETGPRFFHRSGKRARHWRDRPQGPSPLRFSQGIRTARYLYVEHRSEEKELYDLRRDPGELHNLVTKKSLSHVRRQLAAVLRRMRSCRGPGCRAPLAPDLRGR